MKIANAKIKEVNINQIDDFLTDEKHRPKSAEERSNMVAKNHATFHEDTASYLMAINNKI